MHVSHIRKHSKQSNVIDLSTTTEQFLIECCNLAKTEVQYSTVQNVYLLWPITTVTENPMNQSSKQIHVESGKHRKMMMAITLNWFLFRIVDAWNRLEPTSYKPRDQLVVEFTILEAIELKQVNVH